MNKTWIVARREYLYNLRRPAFLFAVFGVPLFTFVMWVIIFAVTASNEENLDSFAQVGYVDEAGVLDNLALPEVSSDVTPPELVAFESEETARAALDSRKISVYFLVQPDYLSNGQLSTYSYAGIPEALHDYIESLMLANVSRQAPPGTPLERIANPVNMTVHVADSGRDLTEANIPALILMPLVFAMIFMMASGVTSGFLMNGVVEEKTNRIMEILVTSISPMQMLLGKVIGLGLLGLTQILVWGAAIVILLNVGQTLPLLQGIAVPVDLMVIFVIYFIFSYFLLSGLMAGIGAVVGSEQESRQWSSIVSLLWVLPFFFIINFLTDPNGTVPVVLTLIPFTAPTTALLRLGFTAVPVWQIILSLAILLLTTALTVWASARVFRWALLRYGKRISIRELLSVIRKSPEAEISLVQSAQEGAR
ncbi:MAG: ABC transporter permease [Chloroflexi bacterium]|nr:ABC transporter permease [Chloroflexota bacterium]